MRGLVQHQEDDWEGSTMEVRQGASACGNFRSMR
jgi:hypothetical protein